MISWIHDAILNNLTGWAWCFGPPIVFILFILGMVYIFGTSIRKYRNAVIAIFVVLGIVLAASLYVGKYLRLQNEDYFITISIDEEENLTEPVHLIIPIPENYPDDYSAFRVTTYPRNSSKGPTPIYHYNISIVSTRYGEMLSVTTNTSILLTSSRPVPNEPQIPHDADFSYQENNHVPIFLENTSQNVSLAIYHELEYYQGLTAWTRRYSAVTDASPQFLDEYHDGNHELLDDARLAIAPTQLEPDWQFQPLHKGSFLWTT